MLTGYRKHRIMKFLRNAGIYATVLLFHATLIGLITWTFTLEWDRSILVWLGCWVAVFDARLTLKKMGWMK